MSKKQISAIVGAIITVLGALGVGGYSVASGTSADVQAEQIKSLGRRISEVESQVRENGKGIAKILGYIKAKD